MPPSFLPCAATHLKQNGSPPVCKCALINLLVNWKQEKQFLFIKQKTIYAPADYIATPKAMSIDAQRAFFISYILFLKVVFSIIFPQENSKGVWVLPVGF